MLAAELCVADENLQMRARTALGGFVSLVEECRSYGGDLRKVIEAVIQKSGLIAALENENTDEARGRVENIKEFLSVVEEYVQSHQNSEEEEPKLPEGENLAGVRQLSPDSLADFIEWVRLRTDLDSMAEDDSAVTLMTVHASKGLEFDVVFVAGMEEDAVPALEFLARRIGLGGRAPSCLCRHYACAKEAVSDVRPVAHDFRRYGCESDFSLHWRDSGRASPDHRSWFHGLLGHGLGEARQPSRHFGLGREAGGGRVFGQSSANVSARRNSSTGGRTFGTGKPGGGQSFSDFTASHGAAAARKLARAAFDARGRVARREPSARRQGSHIYARRRLGRNCRSQGGIGWQGRGDAQYVRGRRCGSTIKRSAAARCSRSMATRS